MAHVSVNRQLICAQPRPSAVNTSLPASPLSAVLPQPGCLPVGSVGCVKAAPTPLQRDRQTDRQTDGRTPYRYINPGSHTMWTEPMKSGMRAKASHYRPRCQVVVNAGSTQDDNQACCHLHRRHRRSSSSIRIQQQYCQRASVDCDIDCQIDVVDDESADEQCRRVACGVSSRRTRCTRPTARRQYVNQITVAC